MTPLILQADAEPYPLMQLVREFWPAILTALVGMAAVYLLLPRVRRFPTLYGGLTASLALVLVGAWLIRAEVVPAETVLFSAFSFIAVASGGVMITQTVPVRAALSFALVVLSTCGLFLLQAAPFLMVATIIIYAGAIVVTFLFVIMLAQQSGLDSADYRSREPLLACIAGFVLLASLLCVVFRTYDNPPVNPQGLQKLEAQLARLARARDSGTAAGLAESLGEDDAFLRRLRETMGSVAGDRATRAASDAQSAVDKVLFAWPPQDPAAVDVAAVREQLTDAYAYGRELAEELANENAAHGSLLADPNLPLSRFSGVPANRVPPRDATGKPRMPADNVLALGRSLFTDYLLAFELVATLLLVATIGAIAISARRTEELK